MSNDTTTVAEAQEVRAAEIKAAQSKARKAANGGASSKPASKATKAATASKTPRQPIPDGQTRSRGRLILSSTGSCTASGKVDGNPGRWPVGQHKALAKANGLTAGTLSCTTHLRALARKAGIVDQAKLEAELIALMAPKARKPRTAKPAAAAPATA